MSLSIGEAVVRVRADAKGFASEAKHSVKEQAGELAKIAGGALAIGGGAEFLKDAISNAVTFQEQMAGLDQTLENVGQGTDKAKRTADNYAEALSKLSGFTRVDVAASLQKATQGTRNLGEAMKVETTAANLARARHIDLRQATLIVTKAFDGNTSSLKRLGISFTPVSAAQDALKAKIAAAQKVTDAATGSVKKADQANVKALKGQLDAAKASDKIATSAKVQKTLIDLTAGGMKTFGDTAAGKLAHVRNAVDEVQTKIGLALLPVISTLATEGAKYVDELDEKWPEITAKVSEVAREVKEKIAPITDAIESLEGPITTVVDYFGGAKTVIKDLGIAVAAFVVISKTIEVATAIYEGLSAAIFLVRNAQIALDVAFEANPIGIIVTALVLLGAALYETYEHSATFRKIVNEAFAAVRQAATVAVAYITTVVLPALRRAWDTIEPPLAKAAGDIEATISAIVSFIRDHWSQITAILGPILRTAVAVVRTTLSGFVAQVENIIDLFGDVFHGRWSSIWGDLVALVTTPLKTLKTVISQLITGLGPGALTAAKAVGKLIIQGLTALPGLAAQLGAKLVSLVGTAVAAAARGAFNLGKNVGALIIQGIAQGIENGAGYVLGKAGDLAKKVADKINPLNYLAEVQTGGSLIAQIEAQSKVLGASLTTNLVDSITTAVTSAKQNLTSMTGSLSSDLGSVIDAAATRQVAKITSDLNAQIAAIPDNLSRSVGGVLAGSSTSAASAKIAADQAARQQRSLQTALASAQGAAATGPVSTTGKPLTPDQVTAQQAVLNQAVVDAQQDLDDYLLQQQIDSDNATYAAAVKAAQDQAQLQTDGVTTAATNAKQAVDNQLALWTQQYNAGKLSQTDFLNDISGLVTAYGAPGGTLNDAYATMGDLLGTAFVAPFQQHLADIQAQILAITKAGPAGTGGTGLGGSITQPSDAVAAQFASANTTVAGDKSALAKANAALATAQAADKKANETRIGPWGVVFPPDPKAKAAADKALAAAEATQKAAETAEQKDAATLAALRAILVKLGIDPNQVIADAAR